MSLVKNIIIIISFFSVIIISCISPKNNSNNLNNQFIKIDTLQLESEYLIKTKLQGYFKIDSNTVLPTTDSNLLYANNKIRHLIEGKSTFKLKEEWFNGNESPSNGIWLTHDNDTTQNYFIINTLQGKLDIHGSNPTMVEKGIKFSKCLFIQEFNSSQKRNFWLLPRIHLEYNSKD